MALHHKLCHVVGGSFNLPHADTHTVILPYAMAYNAKAAPEADQAVARALGGRDGTSALVDLASKLGSPHSLKSLGMKESDIDVAADYAVQNPYWNPRPVERGPIRALIADAWAGNPPKAG
jgi:alcohol dehydrogenase class IV